MASFVIGAICVVAGIIGLLIAGIEIITKGKIEMYTEHFPKKPNKIPEYSDGQSKQCPNCGSILSRYVHIIGVSAIKIKVNGFYCPDCDNIVLNREQLNLAIESILYDNITAPK